MVPKKTYQFRLTSSGDTCLNVKNKNHITFTQWRIVIDADTLSVRGIYCKDSLNPSYKEKNFVNGDITKETLRNLVLREVRERIHILSSL